MTIQNFFFIDARVQNHQAFVAGLQATDAWVLLKADQDGLDQMVRALSGAKDLASIQIISHGAEASLTLGITALNLETVQNHQMQLAALGASLASQGDIQLYGCGVAQGAKGEQFVQAIAQLTQADVAASKDLTGAAAAGGNWTLEYAVGQIDTSVLVPAHYRNTLDNLNNIQGLVTTDIGSNQDIGQSVVLQADGKILLGGCSTNNSGNSYFALVRYNSDGRLDNSFSGDGMLTTAIGSPLDMAHSVTLQADGKILLAGESGSGGNRDFALVRYNSDGSLDSSFSGDGMLTTDLGADDFVTSVALQADGKILLAGYSVVSNRYEFALARYSSDGTLDNSFSGDGKLTFFKSHLDVAQSVTLQADGKILLAGHSGGCFALVRFNSDGSLDSDFSGDGMLTTDFGASYAVAKSMTLQADGKILLAGYSAYNSFTHDFAVARYNSDGTLDSSFSGDGMLTTDIRSTNDDAISVTLQADGKVLVAGNCINTSGNWDFALERFNSDGSLDSSFSGDGMLTTNIGANGGYVFSMALQTNGKILLAGYSNSSSGPDFALARYNNDGNLDTSFGAAAPTPPAIALSTNKTALKTGDTATITFTLSEPSTDFVASDVLVTGGSLSGFSGAGTTYTATFTANANSTSTGTISVPNGAFTDAAGNANIDGTEANNTVTFSVDTVPPVLTASSYAFNLTAADTYWSYWYSNRSDYQSKWNAPGILMSELLPFGGNIILSARGIMFSNEAPSVTSDAAGVYSSNDGSHYIGNQVRLNLPDGTALDSYAIYGSVLIGNPRVGWQPIFQASPPSGIDTRFSENVYSVLVNLTDLFFTQFQDNEKIFITYNDIDTSNTVNYAINMAVVSESVSAPVPLSPQQSIILNFSEPIERGAGSIVLKTSTGNTVATYDAATSSNLSISGNTLTINPTADLSSMSGYSVILAAGTVKDAAGNANAGTSTYNFSTLASTNFNTTAAENTKTVTTLAVTDALLGTAPKYTLSGLDAGLFKVSSKGVLTFAAVKDYEQPVDSNKDGVYEVAVTLSNAKTGYKVVKDLTVGVEFVPINGTTGSDTLKGTAGWDTLDGLAGDDKLTGGTGLDTFLVTSGHDTILDFNALTKGATGTEVLHVSAGATADATLKAAWTATSDSCNEGTANLITKGMAVDLSGITDGLGWNVTNTGAAATIKGSLFDDQLTGGTGNDQMIGGAGNDLLSGGKGADILTGGAGADTFRLGGDTKTDHISDFLSGTDRIELDNLVFKALLTEGQLSANQFAQGTAATTATQRIVYDQPTGNLWYDLDGSGKKAAVLMAVLDNKVQMINTDFWVI